MLEDFLEMLFWGLLFDDGKGGCGTYIFLILFCAVIAIIIGLVS